MVPCGNSNLLGSPCSYAASSQCLPRFPMFTPSSATSALRVFSITAVTLGPGFTLLGPLFYLPNWTKQCGNNDLSFFRFSSQSPPQCAEVLVEWINKWMSESMHIYQYMLCNISAIIGNKPEALLFWGWWFDSTSSKSFSRQHCTYGRLLQSCFWNMMGWKLIVNQIKSSFQLIWTIVSRSPK